MQEYRVSHNDLPPEGKVFFVVEPAVWTTPLREFHIDCRIDVPLKARIHVFPADNGWLVRGTLQGRIIVPCSRCAEDAVVPIDAHFENFEAISDQDENAFPPVDNETDACVVWEGNVPMLDLAAVCWEEFVLALPVTPLCREDCKGLCATCGANLNEESCTCKNEVDDPRMAKLRGLIVHNG